MKKRQDMTVEQMIQTAVTVAVEAAMQGIDDKIQAAVNLGVTIGAAAGAEIGAAAAVKAVEREKRKVKKDIYDRRFHNVKLLLRHYRQLNEHYKNAVFDIEGAEDADETFSDLMDNMKCTIDEDFFVESIKKSALKTKIIMTHVNRMIDVYEEVCGRSNRTDDKRHFRVLKALYLDDHPTTAGAIANVEHIDKRTVYKDIDATIADMTMLLFGIEGIEKL